MDALRAMLFAGLSFLFLSPSLLLAADYEIGNYTLVGSTRISRTVYENTYKASVRNGSVADAYITATVASSALHITVIQGAVSFDVVPRGATQDSTGTFIVRHDRSKPFDPNALVWTVQARPSSSGATALRVIPARLSMNVEGQAMLSVLNAVGAVTWSSNNPSVVTVQPTGAIRAVARGSAIITANNGSMSSTTAIQVYDPAGAIPDATSESLIAQELAANRINAEQALIYRVFAAVGDQRLPVGLRGAPDNAPHAYALREAAGMFNSLSPDAQATLRPFLLPPVYAESWFAQQLGLTAPTTLAAPSLRALAAAPSSCVFSSILERRSTAHFNIWSMPTDISRSQAAFVASVIEEIYNAEAGLLNRFPLPDSAEPCNGGDGAIDIYIFPTGISGKMAETVAYPGRCEAVPAYIVINEMETSFYFLGGGFAPEATKQLVKAPLVHELLHAIQFGMDRAAACANYQWIDEATAQWAIDFVYPTLNAEDGIKKTRQLARSGEFFTDYLLGGHMVALENPSNADNAGLNGYGDYIFFQFLARKYGAATIKNLFDAWTSSAAVESLDVGLAVVGTDMETAWPEFAKVLWNDFTHQVLNDLSQWDNYDYGMAGVFDQPAQYSRPHRTLEITQQGASRASFNLLQNAAVSGGSFKLEPRSMFFERLIFTDNTVSSVLVSNPIPLHGDVTRTRLQTVMKINGQWRPAEDWTSDVTKFFCRDKQGERLEELILIVSNSEGVTTLPAEYPLMVSTSNVGCWKWQGTASTRTTTSSSDLATYDGTASAIDVVYDPTVSNFQTVSTLQLAALSGTVRGNATTVDRISPCTVTQTGRPTLIDSTTMSPSWIGFNLDLKSFPVIVPNPDRKVVLMQNSTFLDTTIHQVCPTLNIDVTHNISSPWFWLTVPPPLPVVNVSNDGRTLEGNITQNVTYGQTTYNFRFTAMRE